MLVNHHPDDGSQPLHQTVSDLRFNPAGRAKVNLGLHPGVGSVGVLSTRAARRTETPPHLFNRYLASRSRGQEALTHTDLAGGDSGSRFRRRWYSASARNVWRAERIIRSQIG